MSQIQDTLKAIHYALLNRDLDQAAKMLKGLKTETAAQSREAAHQAALLDFYRGDTASARSRAEAALVQYGDNVNLVCDLAVFLYHSQDMLNFRATVDKLERTLVELETKLSNRSLYDCELTLGKFLEEEARLVPSLIYYERALQRAENTPQRLRATLQKARWIALYDPKEELSGLYRELISVPTDQVTRDLAAEFEHCLLLIELRLIGADHAWQRYERIAHQLDDADQRLLVFDYVEGLLSQDQPVLPSVLEILRKFSQMDPFEKYIRSLAEGSLEATEKLQELNRLATQVSWASYLRALCITANFETQSSVKLELNRKIQLLIRSLDPKSQGLWNSRLKQAFRAPEVRLDFSLKNRSITVQGKVVDLSKKKLSQQLLSILVKKPTLSIDQAIEHLWQSSFTPEHYHRLRMGVHRLNTLVNECSGQGKIIEVDSQEVRVRPEVKLRAADDFLESSLSLN